MEAHLSFTKKQRKDERCTGGSSSMVESSMVESCAVAGKPELYGSTSSAFIYPYQIDDSMLCARNIEDDGVDSCTGNNGGPLIVYGKANGTMSAVLVAVVPWWKVGGCRETRSVWKYFICFGLNKSKRKKDEGGSHVWTSLFRLNKSHEVVGVRATMVTSGYCT